MPLFNYVNEPKRDENKPTLPLTRTAFTWLIILGILALVGIWIAGNFNSLVVAKNQVDNSWAKVETQYQRRLDLIDNIVSSVKGAQGQELAVINSITDARKAYNNASSTSDKAAAASSIESNVAVLPRLQEAYPDLKSNTQVTALINELSGTENSIAGARDTYNDTATNYNTNIASFPKNLFAGLFGYNKQALFKAQAGAATAPKVQF